MEYVSLFNLGGMVFEVYHEAVPGYRWKSYITEGKVYIAPDNEGVLVSQENRRKALWEAIFVLANEKIMLRTKSVFEDYFVPYQNMIAQVMPQLQEYWLHGLLNLEAKYRKDLIIGASTIRVEINNEICSQKKVYGRYDPNKHLIQLQSIGTYENGGQQFYHKYFIFVTLIHEVLHAIADQLGLQNTKWDTEHQINTLSYFLGEAVTTMRGPASQLSLGDNGSISLTEKLEIPTTHTY